VQLIFGGAVEVFGGVGRRPRKNGVEKENRPVLTHSKKINK